MPPGNMLGGKGENRPISAPSEANPGGDPAFSASSAARSTVAARAAARWGSGMALTHSAAAGRRTRARGSRRQATPPLPTRTSNAFSPGALSSSPR
jgi:hypothetical protein